MDLDSIFESNRYGECSIVSFKELIDKQKNFRRPSTAFKVSDNDRLFDTFRQEISNRLQPIMVELIERLRLLENKNKGDGIIEIERMLMNGEINNPIYLLLKRAVLSGVEGDKLDYFGSENDKL